MRRALFLLVLVAAALLLFNSCSEEQKNNDDASITDPDKDNDNDGNGDGDGEKKPVRRTLKRILVDHILVSFRDAKPNYGATRSKEEARRLAQRLLDMLRDGKLQWARLKKERSDTQDRPYFVVAKGFKPQARTDGLGEVFWEAYYAGPRKIAFKLKAGEFGLAEYHERHCPDGYRIVYRIDAQGLEYK